MAEYQFSPTVYQQEFIDIQKTYVQYPYYVTIETLALCNAACNFCPYITLERKGEEMTYDLFMKIIKDLEDIPKSHTFYIHLSRVSEPFLDKRVFELHKLINIHLPQARICFFSNGSLLDQNKIDRLSEIDNIWHMNISLNHYQEEEYHQLMKIPFWKTKKSLDTLHQQKENGLVSFPISLSRVGDATPEDRKFVEWCMEQYPLFDTLIIPRGDWMGLTPPSDFVAPDAGCKQWFQLHILANGKDAYCCIDAEGNYGQNLNAATTHVLDIYNSPSRIKTRTTVQSRRDIDICSGCTMYS